MAIHVASMKSKTKANTISACVCEHLLFDETAKAIKLSAMMFLWSNGSLLTRVMITLQNDLHLYIYASCRAQVGALYLMVPLVHSMLTSILLCAYMLHCKKINN